MTKIKPIAEARKSIVETIAETIVAANPRFFLATGLELARLYQEFAQICMIQGRTDVAQDCRRAAETLLQRVLATEPANYRALRALGYLKEQSGDVAGAVFEYQRSLQAYPQQPDLESRVAALTK